MKLTRIYSYPLKSGKAIDQVSAELKPMGILYDRSIIVIDENNKAITGREMPELTSITALIESNMLHLSKDGRSSISTALPFENEEEITFRLFRNKVEGIVLEERASDWMSTLLGVSCRLVSIGDKYRPIDRKLGGKMGDLFGYADASPIHLISEESLKELNSRLYRKVTPLHFRPNFIVQGGKAFEEDTWKTVAINGCEFEVHQKCKRCIFTTIDPMTNSKDDTIEPLTTLANFRKGRNEELTFGIYLVPRKTGQVHVEDAVISTR